MKLQNIIILLFASCVFLGCADKVDPEVDTLYLKDGDYNSRKVEAFSKLYHHYLDSKKDRRYHEVVSKGDFILNYYPDRQLLTLCTDPGSGWGNQFKNVSEATLQNLVIQKFTFDDIAYIGTIGSQFDSVLVLNTPREAVKSNGNPDL